MRKLNVAGAVGVVTLGLTLSCLAQSQDVTTVNSPAPRVGGVATVTPSGLQQTPGTVPKQPSISSGTSLHQSGPAQPTNNTGATANTETNCNVPCEQPTGAGPTTIQEEPTSTECLPGQQMAPSTVVQPTIPSETTTTTTTTPAGAGAGPSVTQSTTTETVPGPEESTYIAPIGAGPGGATLPKAGLAMGWYTVAGAIFTSAGIILRRRR